MPLHAVDEQATARTAQSVPYAREIATWRGTGACRYSGYWVCWCLAAIGTFVGRAGGLSCSRRDPVFCGFTTWHTVQCKGRRKGASNSGTPRGFWKRSGGVQKQMFRHTHRKSVGALFGSLNQCVSRQERFWWRFRFAIERAKRHRAGATLGRVGSRHVVCCRTRAFAFARVGTKPELYFPIFQPKPGGGPRTLCRSGQRVRRGCFTSLIAWSAPRAYTQECKRVDDT